MKNKTVEEIEKEYIIKSKEFKEKHGYYPEEDFYREFNDCFKEMMEKE